MKFLPLFLLAATLLVGCSIRPLKPGFGWIQKPDGSTVGVQQSENPKTDSTQDYEKIVMASDGSQTTEKVKTKIGASQKDFAREAAAKLASLRPVMYVGILVFLFGAASAFWPPLKLIVGSITTSAVIAAAGLALIILPTFIVGNELLILGVALGGAGLYFFAHRHAKARGELETLKR